MTTFGSTPITAPEPASEVLHVAAAAVFDAAGRVLIAQRRVDVHQGGLWEFPGGKLEPGESVEAALSRELWEELHIRPRHARRMIRVPFRYPERHVLLDVWRVDAYEGEAIGREGQPILWVEPRALDDYAFPAANLPIVNAVRLPQCYLVTGAYRSDSDFLERLSTALARGVRLVQLRAPKASPALLREAVARCRRAGAISLYNGTPDEAVAVGADGVHLSAARLRALTGRPSLRWVAASCHDAEELRLAEQRGADFVVLSPVQPTTSHPGAVPLGWSRFAELVRDYPAPVYALGGVGEGELGQALRCRAQGIAAIRALWGRQGIEPRESER